MRIVARASERPPRSSVPRGTPWGPRASGLFMPAEVRLVLLCICCMCVGRQVCTCACMHVCSPSLQYQYHLTNLHTPLQFSNKPCRFTSLTAYQYNLLTLTCDPYKLLLAHSDVYPASLSSCPYSGVDRVPGS